MDLDLTPLLETLDKITRGRILPVAALTSDADLHIAKIPVRMFNPGDKKDVTLRRYAADWIRKAGERIGVDARFEEMRGQVWHQDDGEEIPIVGAVVLTWWQKPEMSDMDLLMKQQRANGKKR
jgi:hypothetical protein